MAKARRKKKLQEEQPPAQRFDTAFKEWIRKEAREVLPLFIPGATYEETLDVEIIRPTMRADKVFKGKYEGDDTLFNIEFQSTAEEDLVSRLLVYNSVLYRDHGLPVISMIVYPFRTKMEESPLVIQSGKRTIITFDFEKFPFFLQQAEHYVRHHLACMYPIVPTMQGANREMIKQITDELAVLYRDDEVSLAQQLVWMELLLERTETIPLPEKDLIKEDLKVYDPLWEEHPKVKKIRTESRAEGEVQALRGAVVTIVKTRFPALTEMAQQKAAQLNNPAVLNYLIAQISAEPDENGVRALLRPTAA